MSGAKNTYSYFSLFRLKQKCYYSPVSIDFTPLVRHKIGSTSITPRYNNDSNYFTQAFVNPFEESLRKTTQQKNIEAQKEKFQEKIRKSMSEHSEQSLAFDPQSTKYCMICKLHFEGYWKHINSTSHRTKIKNSGANTYIYEMCEKYRVEKDAKKQKHKSKAQNIQGRKNKKNKKVSMEEQVDHEFQKQDFLISIPKEFISKDFIQGSTNGGAVSLEQKK